ncbi:MarR family winged helix-turn-helix transcriptional regulator [Rathayibacter soli]|uniref:MarR family winged helix-turn-helix transcriptional regulator n=1 Tax=Rathayibacter soli TaxID=3144168 RepID=UPI0027E4053B|nr:MarR family transcriptional regulator [Glaciibacter superstes]
MLLLHQRIAESLGLGPTDLKCLDLCRGEKNVTAGRVAEVTGLSTSAVTAALDRLETAGFITRERDTKDRRKVLVRSTGRRDAEVEDAFAPLARTTNQVLLECSAEELDVIARVLRKMNAVAAEPERLDANPQSSTAPHAAPTTP